MHAATVTVWLRAVLVRRALVSVLANRKAAMALAPDPKKNHLLAALPAAYLQRWLPQLEAVEMPLGHVLYESGRTLSRVLSNPGHRLAAVCDGKRRVGRSSSRG
jgi:hypothetical protein